MEKKYLNAGNRVLVNADEILSICSANLIPVSAPNIIDVSGGAKRSAIITRSNIIFIVNVRCDTLQSRLLKLLNVEDGVA